MNTTNRKLAKIGDVQMNTETDDDAFYDPFAIDKLKERIAALEATDNRWDSQLEKRVSKLERRIAKLEDREA